MGVQNQGQIELLPMKRARQVVLSRQYIELDGNGGALIDLVLVYNRWTRQLCLESPLTVGR